MQEELDNLTNAIEAAGQSGRFFCEFLSPNDAGVNGAHQDGVYLNSGSWDIFFNNASVSVSGIE
ncbi:DNA binding protein [Halobacillus mangrovi]|uniref:Uncharacterized protein n=1 Tax=Halobacillus mangrovi TaxID=402384 RepID=A0A1W5ZQS9_9BACI|nr:EcoRII N-terminal effector-binding domain-containing protein [Halobacillus mangrovi]ARI75650.1 hypothetical protein HM131_01885 [Halobacillus mangrovi]